jgi:hypothetical protein
MRAGGEEVAGEAAAHFAIRLLPPTQRLGGGSDTGVEPEGVDEPVGGYPPQHRLVGLLGVEKPARQQADVGACKRLDLRLDVAASEAQGALERLLFRKRSLLNAGRDRIVRDRRRRDFPARRLRQCRRARAASHRKRGKAAPRETGPLSGCAHDSSILQPGARGGAGSPHHSQAVRQWTIRF